MSLLPRKGLLAIAAVVDVALRHVGILKGIRGLHGGYELARERRGVTASDILRAAGTVH